MIIKYLFTMKVTQVRNALLMIEMKGKKIVIDPWLAPKGSEEPFPCPIPGRDKLRNPTSELPLPVDTILEKVDAIFVTHHHPDHFDEYSVKYIDKNQLLYAQNEEEKKEFENFGFKNVKVVTVEGIKLGDITVKRVIGLHGETPETKLPGESSGYLFEAEGLKKLYIAGDTIYFDGVKKALDEFKPEIVVLNACGATLTDLGRIIMHDKDVLEVCKQAPYAKVIASHMEAVNHYTVTRKDLKEFLDKNNVKDQVIIPLDGDVLNF